MLLALAILATLGSLVWTYIVFLGNAMSDAPTVPFQGGISLVVVWVVTVLLYVAWYMGR